MRIPTVGAEGTILMVGAAGGVGSIAVQLARRAGLEVVATASREASRRWAESMGAHRVIDHRRPMTPQLKDLGVGHMPYLFCLTSPDPHWADLVEALAPEGTICSILAPGSVPLGPLWANAATLAAELMFVRPRFETASMIEQHRLDAGTLSTTLAEAKSPIAPDTLTEIFAAVKTGHTIGKLVAEGWVR